MKILFTYACRAAGGVEMHVSALSRELAARGYDVTVASLGDACEGSLDGAGVKHVTIPLYKKNPVSVLRCRGELKKLISREKFDIVHAHDRIAAFACGKLARRIGVCFITSAHGDFEAAPLSSLVSDWGEHTFAASCDIKEYLKNRCGVPSDNITLIDDGMDTERLVPTPCDVCVENEQYSARKMTDGHVRVYKKLTPYSHYAHGDIIISGYYGYKNIGDDSLLTPIIDGIRERIPGAKITVLAKNPRLVSRICRVRTIHRFNIPAIWREMKSARLLISGGGSLLQDGTSKKSLMYYVYVMHMAKRRGLKVMLYANGLGPLVAQESRRHAAEVIANADYVSFRERASLELARELGVKRDISVSADPAFLLNICPEPWIDHIRMREGIDGSYFIVSVKDGNNFDGAKTGRDVISTMACDIRALADKYSIIPVFVPMYPARDTLITKQLAEAVGCGKIFEGLTASELCALMKDAEFVIGTRLHMLIFAASMAVPMLGISYDPKIDAFLDYIGQSSRVLDIRSLSKKELFKAADALIGDSDAVRSHLAGVADELCKKAQLDCDALVHFFEQK